MRTCSSLSSNAIGVAADNWMALMDRLLTLKNYCLIEDEEEHVKENMLKLIDIYYEALDAPKQGGRKVSYVFLWLLQNLPLQWGLMKLAYSCYDN